MTRRKRHNPPQGERVWAIVYAAFMLDTSQRFMGRMQGVPSHQEDAVAAATTARAAWLKLLKEERAKRGTKDGTQGGQNAVDQK